MLTTRLHYPKQLIGVLRCHSPMLQAKKSCKTRKAKNPPRHRVDITLFVLNKFGLGYVEKTDIFRSSDQENPLAT